MANVGSRAGHPQVACKILSASREVGSKHNLDA